MKAKSVIQFIIFFGLAIFLLWYSSKDIQLSELKQYIVKADKLYILLIIIAGYLSVLFRAVRWQQLIEPLGKKPGLLNTCLSILIGYGVNYFTPRMGEVARCAVLSKYEGIGADKLAGTMIAERFFDLICLVIVVLLGLAIEFDTVHNYFNEKILATLQAKLGPNALWIIGGVALAFCLIIFIVIKRILKSQTENKFMKIIKNLSEGFTSIFHLQNKASFLLYSAGIWIMYWGMAFLGFKAIAGTAHLGGGAGLSVLTLGSVGIIATPGGTGAYQLLVSNLLSSLYQVGTTDAYAYAMLSWLVQSGILIIGSVVAFLVFPLANKNKKTEHPIKVL
jgi:glycosyltransferase 2 family protein